MKKWLKRIIIWIAIILLIFGIPLLINILFKHNFGVKWIQSEWSAGEALSFYGALLGGAITLLGVIITLRVENKKKQQEDAIVYKPILTIEGINLGFKCLVRSVNIGFPISQYTQEYNEEDLDLFTSHQNSDIEKCKLYIKNSGRGETYDTVLTSYDVECSWDDISDLHPQSGEQYIGEVIKDGYIGISMYLPDYLILPKKNNKDLNIWLTMNIDYSDMFNIYRYRLKLAVNLKVIPLQEQQKHPLITDKNYCYTTVKYKLGDIMPAKQIYSEKDKDFIDEYFLHKKN